MQIFPLSTHRVNVPPSKIHARTHMLSHLLLPTNTLTPPNAQIPRRTRMHARTRMRTHTCLLNTLTHTHTHTQLLAVVGLIPSVHYAGLALVHIFLRDKGEIIDGTKLGVFCFIAGSTGYMNFQLLFYPSLPKAQRRWLAVTGTNSQNLQRIL